MPVWLRTFHVKKINEYHKEENEKISKAQKGQNTVNKPVQGPNINPSSVYNFKK